MLLTEYSRHFKQTTICTLFGAGFKLKIVTGWNLVGNCNKANATWSNHGQLWWSRHCCISCYWYGGLILGSESYNQGPMFCISWASKTTVIRLLNFIFSLVCNDILLIWPCIAAELEEAFRERECELRCTDGSPSRLGGVVDLSS